MSWAIILPTSGVQVNPLPKSAFLIFFFLAARLKHCHQLPDPKASVNFGEGQRFGGLWFGGLGFRV